MTTTTICTTCGRCRLGFEVPSTDLVLALPAPAGDTGAEPSFVAMCPSCGACDSTSIPWRTAAYLLHAGATTITAPDPGRISPSYPERPPLSTSPMTLDDLIDLRALLDTARPL
jgi:hypothetical protein